MSAVPVTAHQVRSKVAWVLQKEPDALVIGLHAAGPWQGDGELDLGERRFAVVRADTVLEVREALADAEAPTRPTVVLTAAGAGRAGPGRRRPPGPQQALPGRPLGGGQGPVQGAAARPVAPRPLPGRGAAGAPPPGGEYPPVPAGVLDAGTAWRAILHHAFGMEDREPDLPGLLRWAARRPGRAATSRPRPNSATPRVAAWPRRWGRPPGRSSTSSRGARPATRSAWPSPARSSSPRGRTSPPSRPPPRGWSGSTATGRSRRTSAGLLARAGRDAIDDLDRDEPEAGPGPPAAGRRAAPRGPGRALRPPRPADAAGLGGAPPPVRPGAGRRDRPRGRGRPGRLPRTRRSASPTMRMPGSRRTRTSSSARGWRLRLARWLRTPEAHEGSFAQLAGRYRDEVALVDRARDALAGGDDLAELSDAYARLERAVAARRAAFNRAFGVGPGRLDPQRLGPRRGPPRRGRRWPGPWPRSSTRRSPSSWSCSTA